MKHRRPIIAAMLVALLVALLSGGALAEDGIELGVDGGKVAVEGIPAGDDLELVPDGAAEPDGLSLEWTDDELTLDDALIIPDALPSDAAAIEPERNAIAPNDDGDIPIDEAHFPDPAFRSKMQEFDNLVQDGVLSPEERAGVTQISFYGQGLAELNLEGIEYFPALKFLWCSSNQLTSLDLSPCASLTNLEYLGCSNNKLTSLDASGLTALTKFEYNGNPLTHLTAIGCTSLTGFYTYDLPLVSLNVSGCTGMTGLNLLSLDQLEALDVSGCTGLTELYCAGDYSNKNRLARLKINDCTSLTRLICHNTLLTSLDVSGCTALTELFCNDSKLTSLDVSRCTALTKLNCSNNNLADVKLSGCTALIDLTLNGNSFIHLDLSGCSSLKSLYYPSGQLASLDVSGCTALKKLNCEYNQLTSLDVGGCTALDRLECTSNQLSKLDLSTCTALTQLFCSGNRLTSLELSGFAGMTKLYCAANKLTSLDLSHTTKLMNLVCEANDIRKLDISNNKQLISVIKAVEPDISEKTGRVMYTDRKSKLLSFDKVVEITANGKTLYDPSKGSEGASQTPEPTATPKPTGKVSLKKCKVSGINDQTYTGKDLTPVPVVKYGGKTLKKGVDYTVAYSDNKQIGKATVTIKGKGSYTDSVKKTFNILPKVVKLSSLTAGKGQLTVKWKKGAGGVGYELQYSLKKNFSTKKTVTVSKNATVKKVIKNLASGKTWYVRIRAFKKVDKTKYVSDWSDVLSKKVK